MSRASVPPSSPPTKTSTLAQPALATIPNGKAHDAKSPEPESAASPAPVHTAVTPAPNAVRSPSPTPAPEEKGKSKPAEQSAKAAKEEGAEDEEASETETDPIDMETFSQILELDEDDTYEFSAEMVVQYFSQAETTFDELDQAFETKNLASLSNLGHFLKGSSAALGVRRVQATCEKIQHYGKLHDEEAGRDLTEEQALGLIAPLLRRVKKEYAVAERWLKEWYRKEKVTL